MPFHSSLVALQRLRTGLEKMARLRLQAIHAQIKTATTKLQETEQERLAVRNSNVAALKAGINGAGLQLSSVAALDFEERQWRQRLQELAQEVQKAHVHFIKCRREREIVENAINLQRVEYQQKAFRREQARVDDDTLGRFSRSREQETSV